MAAAMVAVFDYDWLSDRTPRADKLLSSEYDCLVMGVLYVVSLTVLRLLKGPPAASAAKPAVNSGPEDWNRELDRKLGRSPSRSTGSAAAKKSGFVHAYKHGGLLWAFEFANNIVMAVYSGYTFVGVGLTLYANWSEMGFDMSVPFCSAKAGGMFKGMEFWFYTFCEWARPQRLTWH